MNFFDDWELEENSPTDTYEQGQADGKADAITVQSGKPGENGYGLDKYATIRDRYMTAITVPKPTDYQRGYAEAYDMVSEGNATATQLAI